MISTTKRRLVSLASASAIIGTMALAAVPASAMAASPDCYSTGLIRGNNENLTAAQISGVATGELDATGCDIGVYNPTKVTNADIHGALWYGVVVNGDRTVNTTGSEIHDIGDTPLNGVQRGRAILYINGAEGTISGNKIYDFQKSGIVVSGQDAAEAGLSAHTTSASILSNVIIGEGHIDYIAQNAITIRDGATATVKNNAVSHFWYTPDGTESAGVLNHNAGTVTVSGNTFVDTESPINGAVTANVTGSSAIAVRPHGVRVDLRSDGKPAPQATLGAKLDWKVKVDGRVAVHVKQGFGDHDVFRQHFADGSGRHVIKVFKNDDLVRRVIVRF